MSDFLKRVVTFDSSQLNSEDDQIEVQSSEPIEELDGDLKKQEEHDKLMSSVMQNDKETIDDGKLILESINRGTGSFTPDMMMENLVSNYQNAEQIYGEVILRELTNYSPNYIQKNIKIPEFQREIRKNIEDNIDKLKGKDLINKDGHITDEGMFLSSLILYTEELDKLVSTGMGEKHKKEKETHGVREDTVPYKKSRFKDLDVKKTIKTSIRRGHSKIILEDIKIFERKSKGKITVIYGVDSSGSMKGDKLATAKKAGVALSFKAIHDNNDVGLIVFGSDVKNTVYPCKNFMNILKNLTSIRASMETDLSKTIHKAIDMFPSKKETKHLILLTDALPTKGDTPERDTLQAASLARDHDITISIIGIQLDDDGEALAKRIIEVSNGRLYKVNDLANVDKIILQDYDSL